MSKQQKLSPIERIKTESKGLRGTLKESLQDEITGALREDDQASLALSANQRPRQIDVVVDPHPNALRQPSSS